LERGLQKAIPVELGDRRRFDSPAGGGASLRFMPLHVQQYAIVLAFLVGRMLAIWPIRQESGAWPERETAHLQARNGAPRLESNQRHQV